MKLRLLAWWDRILSSYWFMPCGMMAVMFWMAIGLPIIDAQFNDGVLREMLWLKISPQSAQSILSSIAGANVSVVGVVFSITILTLSIASTQMGPRLLRTFLSDRSTHFALGLYLSTAVYCLILLTIVKDREDAGFVPHLSVVFALIAAIFGLGFLVFFINRIAQLIQTPNIVAAVARDLDHALIRLFPEELGESADEEEDCEVPDRENAAPILALEEGYLQGTDIDSMVEFATEADILVRMVTRPGKFVTKGTVIADVYPKARVDEDLQKRFNEFVICGIRRTPRQDVECSVNELTEVAVRALSPGVNDPFTASNCIDCLGASLSRFSTRKIPNPCRRDEAGTLRVIVQPDNFPSALNAAFDQIRQYGADSPAILIRLLESLSVVASAAKRREDRAAVLRQAKMIFRAVERNIHEENDRADILERYDLLLRILANTGA